jgi:hypothetical protein
MRIEKPIFHSKHLQESIDKVDPSLTENRNKIENICEDIKNLEEYLLDRNTGLEVHHYIPSETTLVLKWKKTKTSATWKIFVHESESQEERVLTDCHSDLKARIYPYLSDFVEAFLYESNS